jgi:ribonuclease HI
MDFKRIMIFTDGACSGNPGPGGWGAIVATPDGHVKELGEGRKETTNNKMELTATIQALKFVQGTKEGVDVYTDSVYVIRGITQWIWGWRKRGWLTGEGNPVANKSHWQALAEIVESFPSKSSIGWHYVRGHVGIPGNERADDIAVICRDGKRPDLYDGPLIKYGIPIHDIPDDTSVPEPKASTGKKKQAYSYVSVVNGEARRHKTWPECEQAVKGRSGARFKKALSAADELEILASWGVDPGSVK